LADITSYTTQTVFAYATETRQVGKGGNGTEGVGEEKTKMVERRGTKYW